MSTVKDCYERDGAIESFVVICRDDRLDEEQLGHYVLATRKLFTSLDAAQAYVKTISPSRQPIIVPGRWHEPWPAAEE